MTDDRLRLFVALELPEPVRDELVRWQGRVVSERAVSDRGRSGSDRGRSLRPVAAEALHATLCFLGWRAEKEVEAIAAACSVISPEPPPALSLGSSLWLPRRRPRVLTVQLVDPTEQLGRIQSALSAALAAGGWYEPETRPYLAHVTVARVKSDPRAAGTPELPEPPRLDFHGRQLVLYRSRLSRTGARYEPLATIELGRRA